MDSRELYGLPLERFTAERNALAKQLRGDGRREQASEVSKLRKPSVAAWAVNQLVRTQRREVDTLFRAGEELTQAQSDLLAGRVEPPSLREAVEAERVAVERLVTEARGLLSADGHELTQARLDQVSETLHAAALDDEAREEVGDGCLVREFRHVGLGGLATGAKATARGKSARRKPGPESRRRPAPRSQTPKDEAKQRKAALSAARRAEGETRRRLERAGRGVTVAQERRDRADSELQAAEGALAEARAAREQAAERHDEARAALERLSAP